MPDPKYKVKISNRAVDSVRAVVSPSVVPRRTEEVKALIYRALVASLDDDREIPVTDADYPANRSMVAEVSIGGAALVAVMCMNEDEWVVVDVVTQQKSQHRWSTERWTAVGTDDVKINRPFDKLAASLVVSAPIDPALATNEGLTDKVREAMADGKQRSTTDVAIIVGARTADVGDVMKKLTNQGELTRVSPGVYREVSPVVEFNGDVIERRGEREHGTMVERIEFAKELIRRRPHINAMGRDGVSAAVKDRFGVGMAHATIAEIRVLLAKEAPPGPLSALAIAAGPISQVGDLASCVAAEKKAARAETDRAKAAADAAEAASRKALAEWQAASEALGSARRATEEALSRARE